MPYHLQRNAANTLNADGTPKRNHPYREPGTTMNICLSDGEVAHARECIKDLIQHWSLDCVTPQVDIKQTAHKRGTNNKNTVEEYKKCWRECFMFSVRVGCWRTATLMGDELRPFNPLPAVPQTIRHYWMWKCTPKDSPVLERDRNNERNGAELTWADGTVMYGCGAWHSPGCIKKSNTAIGLLHDCHTNLRGTFEEECPVCQSANPDIDFSKAVITSTLKSCHDHLRDPLLKPRGNAMNDKVVTDEFTNLKQELYASHETKGNIQLTPSQVRAMRRELLKPSHKGPVASISGQQLYLMILLGIKTFGRSDDTCEIKMADFPRGHVSIGLSPFLVRHLSVYVKGKGKRGYTLLRLFRDDTCPEFCPVRHLLAYLHVTGIAGEDDTSFLFPKIQDLQEHVAARQLNPTLKKRFNTPVPYSNFKDRMKVSVNDYDYDHLQLPFLIKYLVNFNY